MALLVFQHVEYEAPAELGSILQNDGHRLRIIELYNGGIIPADLDDVDGVVSMGGPMNVDQAADYPWIEHELNYLKRAHGANKPIVGICLGAQMIATALGGQVQDMEKPEVGWQPLTLAYAGTVDTLYLGVPWNTVPFHLHGQEITGLPPGGTLLASSAMCRHQAFKVGLRTYGFQYHFECNESQIDRFARDGMVEQAGATADEIVESVSEHYDSYRRLGDRLAHNIAAYLFSIKRPLGVRG